MTAPNEQNSPARASFEDADTGGVGEGNHTPQPVDLHEAAKFLHALDPDRATWHFRTFPDKGKGKGKGQNFSGTLDSLGVELSLANGNTRGVFAVVNDGGHKKNDITRVVVVFADFDGTALPETLPLPPHAIVESSSGKYHLYWRVDGLAVADFTPHQQAIAAALGSDPSVTDASRVMRLPGFVHHKSDPFLTRLIHSDGRPPYSAVEVAAAFPVSGYTTQNRPRLKTQQHALQRQDVTVVEVERHSDARALTGRIARLVVQAGLDTESGWAAVMAEANRGRWTRDMPEDELRRAFDGALANLRSGKWEITPPTDHQDGEPIELIPLDLRDLRTATICPPDYVFSQIVPRCVPTLLTGHGEAGKSTLTLAIFAHAACGQSWAGFACERPMRCVFFSFEDNEEIVLWRLRAVADTCGLDYDLIAANLTVIDLSDADAALVSEVPSLKAIRETPTFKRVVAACAAAKADLIGIDNASDVFDGNENDRRQVRYFLRLLRRLCQQTNAGLILLAHVNKEAAKNGSKGEGYSGSTAWHNSVRSRLYMAAGPEGLALLHEKHNFGPKAEPRHFRWLTAANGAGVQILLSPSDGNDGRSEHTLAGVDADAVLLALGAAADADIQIPSAMAGSATAARALGDFPELPRALIKDKAGRGRFGLAITKLRREKRVEVVEVAAPNRNTKLVLKLTQAGRDDLPRVRASIPHTPSATDARALEAACVVSSDATHATHATDATNAGGDMSDVMFSPFGQPARKQ